MTLRPNHCWRVGAVSSREAPFTEAPPLFTALTCGCGAAVVVGPAEIGARREILCSSCRAERVVRVIAGRRRGWRVAA